MLKSDVSLSKVFRAALRSVDGYAMYLSVVFYIAMSVCLFQVAKFKAYVCLIMAVLIPLIYLSLRIYSSGGRLSGWVNGAVLVYINYIFFNKFV